MAWLFAPELLHRSSSQCLESEQYALSNEIRIVKKCCSNDNEMEPCRSSRSGMICEHSTDLGGLDEWIASLPGYRASLFLSPVNEDKPEMRGTYGPILCGYLERLDQNTSSWKTCQGSLLRNTSDKSWRIWTSSGSMRNGKLYRRENSELRISGNVSGCWLPTPTAASFGSNQGGAQGRVGKVRHSLETMARKNIWPTPRAQSGTGTGPSRVGHKVDLQTAVGGKLNPEWVEWLMGVPIGWTDLKLLGTPGFQEWQSKHGIGSIEECEKIMRGER